jgi:hypothetical protein
VTDPTAPWQIEFYERDSGGCPVEDFLNGLDKPPRAKVLALIQLLAEQGPTLASTRGWVLLHGFIKQSPKTPERDIRIAEARMTEYLDRQKRVEP